METRTGSGEGMVNRWWRVAGALMMNLPLGALYAWSISVLPLEKEFGWTRTQTSWVFTIAGSTTSVGGPTESGFSWTVFGPGV